ncbi:MAG TPA: hypothetical protein PLE52_01085 [Paludibacteraceae bacterium]|nr:hypothetical protein [Paludibacteraceae bacterium]
MNFLIKRGRSLEVFYEPQESSSIQATLMCSLTTFHLPLNALVPLFWFYPEKEGTLLYHCYLNSY